MTKIYIDTEFNGFGGELISMALVVEDDLYFYEVLECKHPEEWVAKHVIPYLNKLPIDKQTFRKKLQEFLARFIRVEIIADWPEDIMYFCSSLLTREGMMIKTMPIINMTINRKLDSIDSKIPHNALEDAMAIKKLDHESF